jgi:hypothetical protein
MGDAGCGDFDPQIIRRSSMIKKIATAMAALVMSVVVFAQSAGLAGKWEFTAPGTRGQDRLVIDFVVAGNKLSGTITRTDPPGQEPTDLQGALNGDKIVFTVKSPDGNRTITMTGNVGADEISFKREAMGTTAKGPGTGFYGLNGPPAIVARRVH